MYVCVLSVYIDWLYGTVWIICGIVCLYSITMQYAIRVSHGPAVGQSCLSVAYTLSCVPPCMCACTPAHTCHIPVANVASTNRDRTA